MRVALGALFVSIALALCLPASAQERDPFDPLVGQGPGTTTTTTDTTEPEAEAPTQPAPDNERIADTGTNVTQYVGLGLALIVLGAASILMSGQMRNGRPGIPQRGASVA